MQRCRSPGNKNHHVIAPHGRISHGTLLHRLPFANPINLSPPKSSVKSVEKPQQPGGETSGRPHRPATRRFSARPLPRERITSSQTRRCWHVALMSAGSEGPRMGISHRKHGIRAFMQRAAHDKPRWPTRSPPSNSSTHGWRPARWHGSGRQLPRLS